MTSYEDGMTALDRAIEELSAAYNSESRWRLRERVLAIFAEPTEPEECTEKTIVAKEDLARLLTHIGALISECYAVENKVKDLYHALTQPVRELQVQPPPKPPKPVTKAEKNGHRKGSRARGAAAGMGVGGGL